MHDEQLVQIQSPVPQATQANASNPQSNSMGEEGRHPWSFRRSYGEIRRRVWLRLSQHQVARAAKLALFVARMAVVIVDLPVRWLMTLLDTIIGDRGYLTVGSVVGGYLVIFGLIDAKHQQEESRASFERSQFITMVSAGNADSFVAAMKTFGRVQRMLATDQPSLLKPWDWWHSSQPNLYPLWQWALVRLKSCEAAACSKSDKRIDLTGADLRGAYLSEVRLEGTDLQNARLIGADLQLAVLGNADLKGADLTEANLSMAFLTAADLRGAYFRLADLRQADLRLTDVDGAGFAEAFYDEETKLPTGLNPSERGWFSLRVVDEQRLTSNA